MKKIKEITEYDKTETTVRINKNNPLKLSDLGIELPEEAITKVISLRLPTELVHKLKAYASQRDIAYTALIKQILANEMDGKFTSL